MEKAHPDVFNVFLQILDDGRLTDGKGRTVNFSNTIVILTSNLVTDYDFGDKNPDQVRKELALKLKSYLRPELINRIDDIVAFRPLDSKMLEKIADLLLAEVAVTLESRHIKISFTDDLKKEIVQIGFDPEFGARPMRRAVTRIVVNPLSLKILSGELQEGESVTVDFKNGEVVVEK